MNKITFRFATADDLPEIATIQAAAPEAPVWPPASYLDYDCRVALVDGRIAGFLVSHKVAAQECEILNIAVDPAIRRRGIGRALVDASLSAAPHGTTWFLEVRESNAAAIRLYKSIGFVPTGHRKDYYHDPDEAAIVMRFHS
jgi:[ribosomal protein S18]-alanine N-acetyltransferase